jgi:hypothetical protein
MSHKVSRDMAFLFSYVLTVPTVKPFLLHLLLPLQLQELHPRPQVLPWKASMGEPLCTPVRVFSQPKFIVEPTFGSFAHQNIVYNDFINAMGGH